MLCRLAGPASCCSSPRRRTPGSVPRMCDNRVLPSPRSRQEGPYAGIWSGSQSSATRMSPAKHASEADIRTHECKQETVQPGDRDQNDETHVRHGQLLVESDVHLVGDRYAEREHSNKHGNLENTKQTNADMLPA